MNEQIYDVIQVGLGPVGLTMAALVGRYGHTIAAFERWSSMYNLPRAGHIDHEIMRILQSVKAADPVAADAYEAEHYIWKNAKDEVLLDFPWGQHGISGWHSDYMMYQPVLEDALYSRIVDDPNVTTFRGWEVVAIRDQGEYFEVMARREAAPASAYGPARDEETITLRGRYLIGADGARSFVRNWLGIERVDLGFNEKWLDVDMRRHRPMSLDFDMGQICDPARPLFLAPLGKRHRRFEWALLPGETAEELSQPEVAWRLLAKLGVTPEDVSIVRQHVYTFEARIAKEWQRGRVFLIGDAAHTMPPFQGQGMCSGMRDANNLAWKLDLVLRGVAAEALLTTYQPEREPHVRDWVIISIESGKVSCTLDPKVAEERDAAFRAGNIPPIPEIPTLRAGVLHRGEAGVVSPPVGHLSLQARVRNGEENGLFDDIVGPGWVIISIAGDLDAVLSDAQREVLETLRAHVVRLVPPGHRDGNAIEDVEGSYRDYLRSLGWEAIVIRPDFYVFGGVSELSDLPELIDDLAHQLRLSPAGVSPVR